MCAGLLGIAGCATHPSRAVVTPAATTTHAQGPSLSPSDRFVAHLKTRADNGDIRAETCLGNMYLIGILVKPDLNNAEYYISKAWSQDDPWGEILHAIVDRDEPDAARLFPVDVREIEALAAKGNAHAQAYLGYLYLYGAPSAGIYGDFATSRYWLQSAATQDDPDAEAELGSLYQHGWGVAPDVNQARVWFRKAANHSFVCPADFARVTYGLLYGSIIYPEDVLKGKVSGTVIVRVPYNSERTVRPVLVDSSHHAELDNAVIAAVSELRVPTWTSVPNGARYFDLAVDYNRYFADPTWDSAWEKFEFEIRDAVYQKSNLLWAAHPYRTKVQGFVDTRFTYQDGKASSIAVTKSSGDPVLDSYGIKAIREATLPPEPVNLSGQAVHLNFMLSDPWDYPGFQSPEDQPQSAFSAEVRTAIYHAEVAPRHALVFGSPGNGITELAFDIRGGKVRNIRVLQSSGDKEVDKAAVNAVEHAHLPHIPARYAKRTLHMTTHVIFELGSSTKATASAAESVH